MSTISYYENLIGSLITTYGYQINLTRLWNQEWLVRVKTTVPYEASFNSRFFDENGFATWDYQTEVGINLATEIETAYNYMVSDFIEINS